MRSIRRTGGWSAAPARPPGRFRTPSRASGDDELAAAAPSLGDHR
jgi:hypothetical protein